MDHANAIYQNPYCDIFEQFIEDASFLWVLREVGFNQPHYDSQDIADLERRLQAQLDGLASSPDDVWALCEKALEYQEAGEMFISTIVAFVSLESKKIQRVLDCCIENPQTLKGLVSALGWLPAQVVQPWLEKLIRSKDLDHKYIAICGYSARRLDPGDYLKVIVERDDCIGHAELYARCLRLIAELKRFDLISHIQEATSDERDVIKFWSNWSFILLGHVENSIHLREFILNDGPLTTKAADVFFRSSNIANARKLISTIVSESKDFRLALRAIKVLGDTQAIPWVIGLMDQPAYSRLAGEVFSTITGVDLEERQLALDLPELNNLGENANDDIEWDEDENLPWPNVEKIKGVWQKYAHLFPSKQRLLLGKEITEDRLRYLVVNGYQRSRHGAALELSLIKRKEPLVNTRAKLI